MVRCTECNAEALLRSRFNRHEFTSIQAGETRVLDVLHRPVRARCNACKTETLDGTGSRHVFLMYSERADAHLALTLRMRRQDDGRVKVLRQVWLVPATGTAVELEDADDERLHAFWADSRIRCRAVADDPEDAVASLEALARDLPDDPYLLRELGHCLIDAGRAARAVGAFELSLRAEPEQPEILRKVGRLYVSFGDAQRGAELLIEAWNQTDDHLLLHEIIRATYRGRQLGAQLRAAEALLEKDAESLIALKAIAAVQSVADVGTMHDAWCRLRDVAASTGDRGTERTAAFWAKALAHPIPDWTADLNVAQYRARLADELRDLEYDLIDDPEALDCNGGEIPIDIEALSPSGDRLLFVVFDQVPTAVLDQRIAATARAARDDERRRIDAVIPLCRQGLSYGSSRWVSGTPDAELLLLADADTTMTVIDENVAAFALAAERHFGRPLAFDLESLAEVDAILLRLHDDGFGEITYAFQCQVAAYIGQVLCNLIEGARWVAGEGDMDPRVLMLPGGEELNIISKVQRAVTNGAEDSLQYFVGMVLQLTEAA